MEATVDLYNSSYGNFALSTYGEIRFETYGEDYGQTSWVTTGESHEIPKLLQLSSTFSVLEIGCGSGGYAVHLAKRFGCQMLGLDINAEGVRNARSLAEKDKLGARVKFEQCDVSPRLPLGDNAFDAVYSNDVLCHIRQRGQILSDLRRVLKPGGRLLFSDALIVGGLLSNEEIATRSSIGMYFFSPPGENERLIKKSGLKQIEARDTTANAVLLSKRWHDAREKRKAALVASEGEANFAGVQRFLQCVHTLTVEKRLLRFLYVAVK